MMMSHCVALLPLLFTFCCIACAATAVSAASDDDLRLLRNASLRKGIDRVQHAAMDSAAGIAYLAAWSAPGAVAGYDTINGRKTSTVYLSESSAENYVSSLLFVPQLSVLVAGCYGDTTSGSGIDPPGVIVLIDTVTAARVSSLTLSKDICVKISASVLLSADNASAIALFSCDSKPVNIIKVSITTTKITLLSSAPLALQAKEENAGQFVMTADSVLLSMSTGAATDNGPGRIVKLSLDGERRLAGLELVEEYPGAGVMHNGYVYWMTVTSPSFYLVKTASTPQLQRIAALMVQGLPLARCGIVDSATNILYVGLQTWPGIVARVNLTGNAMAVVGFPVVAPGSDRYLAAVVRPNASSNQLLFMTDSGAASVLAFDLSSQNFTGNNFYFDGGESLVSTIVRAETAAATASSSETILLASDTRPGIITKRDATGLAAIATLQFPLGVADWIRGVVVDKFGYGYACSCTRAPSPLARFHIGAMTYVSSLMSKDTESCFHSGVLAPTEDDATTQYAYFVIYFDHSEEDKGGVIKTKITADGISRVAVSTVPSRLFTNPVVNDMQTYVLWGSFSSVAGKIVRITFRTPVTAGSPATSSADLQSELTLKAGEGQLRDGVIFQNYAYFASSTSPPGIVVVLATATPMVRIGRVVQPGVEFLSCVSIGGGAALFGATQHRLLRVQLQGATLSVTNTITVASVPGSFEGLASAASSCSIDGTMLSAADSTTRKPCIYYASTYTSPTYLFALSAAAGDTSVPAPPGPLVALIVISSIIGVMLLSCIVYVAYTHGKNQTARREAETDVENGLLHVPRHTVTIIHGAMSGAVPDSSLEMSDVFEQQQRRNAADPNNNVYSNGVYYAYRPPASVDPMESKVMEM